MITDVVLLNPFHIGDVLFSQKLIYYFYKHNPGYKIRVCIERGHFLLSDIPNVEYVHCPSYMQLCSNGTRTLYMDNTLIINTWIYAINRNTWEIECNYHRVYDGFRNMLNSINAQYQTEFQLPELASINPLYTVPPMNIDSFLAWKETQSGKQNVLYMNYRPQSLQPVPIESHDDVIKQLSRRFANTNFLIANLSAELKTYIADNSITNIYDCVGDFDCLETESCENICKIDHIMRMCDYAVVFDIGACFTYSDDKMFEYNHTILHVASTPNFYNCISGSFDKTAFESKVRLLLANNQEAVISNLGAVFASEK